MTITRRRDSAHTTSMITVAAIMGKKGRWVVNVVPMAIAQRMSDARIEIRHKPMAAYDKINWIIIQRFAGVQGVKVASLTSPTNAAKNSPRRSHHGMREAWSGLCRFQVFLGIQSILEMRELTVVHSEAAEDREDVAQILRGR